MKNNDVEILRKAFRDMSFDCPGKHEVSVVYVKEASGEITDIGFREMGSISLAVMKDPSLLPTDLLKLAGGHPLDVSTETIDDLAIRKGCSFRMLRNARDNGIYLRDAEDDVIRIFEEEEWEDTKAKARDWLNTLPDQEVK